MASTLRKGSSGDEVRKLQQALNKSGYGLTVDGIFGDKTLDAVRKYQKSNGLNVDGIVGSQTWGRLTGGGGNSPTATTPQTAPQAAAPQTAVTPLGNSYNPLEMTGTKADLTAIEGKAPSFAESQAYKDALSALKQHQSAQPGAYQSTFADRLNSLHEQVMNQGAYQSPYAGRIQEIYDKIMDRNDFSYDFNADPLYQQYKDQYMRGGQRAMQDTMAEAATLTGGYGNSYASGAGNLAYHQYLTGLNDVIPELQRQAYQRYQDAGSDLMNRLQITQGLDEMAYGRYSDDLNRLLQRIQLTQDMDRDAYDRYRDEVGDYYTNLEYLTGAAGDQYDRDYRAYQDALDKYMADRDYYYGKSQDELAQENYQNELAAAKKSSGGGSGGSGGKPNAGDIPEENDEQEHLTVGEAQNVLLQIAKSDGLTAASREMQNMLAEGIVDGDDVESKLKYALSMISRR